MGDLASIADEILGAIRSRGTYRRMRILDGAQGPRMEVDGKEVWLFAGSNYLDLARHPQVTTAAARAARVDEFASQLPQGFDTTVGPSGVRLSGGQRQRVTIARALLRDPAILIFDEATSALDAKSERYVHEAIAALLSGRTVFIVAHRLSTIRHADKIAVLKKGSIVGLGTHEELMADEGLYRELMSIQSEGREETPLQTRTA